MVGFVYIRDCPSDTVLESRTASEGQSLNYLTNNLSAFFGSAIISLTIFSKWMAREPLIKIISPGSNLF